MWEACLFLVCIGVGITIASSSAHINFLYVQAWGSNIVVNISCECIEETYDYDLVCRCLQHFEETLDYDFVCRCLQHYGFVSHAYECLFPLTSELLFIRLAASCDGFKRYFEFFYYDDLWHMAHCNPFVLPQVVTDLRGSSKLFGVKMCGAWIPCHGAEAPWIGSTSITPDQTSTSLVFWWCKERCFQEEASTHRSNL